MSKANITDKPKIAIIGGRLQGTEACYLARKAGYYSILIEKNPKAPATGLADEVVIEDVLLESENLIKVLQNADIILPAIENDAVLTKITDLAERYNLPLAFDIQAYRISSSKLLSDELISKLGIPAPLYSPLRGKSVVKPSVGSGSDGVKIFEDAYLAREYAEEFEAKTGEKPVFQEYIEGPAYSIEVIGKPGNYNTYEITQIHVDDVRDCCLVSFPCDIPEKTEAEFRADSIKIAEAINLHGIMDVEAILSNGQMYILEIDARIPSQTPACILAGTGLNLLEELVNLFVSEKDFKSYKPNTKPRAASYENIIIDERGATASGEHIMSEAAPLNYRSGTFAADEEMTDRNETYPAPFKGIFINSAETQAKLEARRKATYKSLESYASQEL
jgi:pyrrolysine biosynthesis protein PylC